MIWLSKKCAGYRMIRSIDIRNFRCFRHLNIPDWGMLNVVVGDNGAGKTALLESIFLPLGASTELGMRLRQQRGLDGSFQGSVARIEAALWGGFFHNHDMSQVVSLTLDGDGVEGRSLEIAKSNGEAVFSGMAGDVGARETGLTFTWKDSGGALRSAKPVMSKDSFNFPDTGENLPDFHYYAANTTIGSVEVASKFSELSQAGLHDRFIQLFRSEYSWIEDLNVEVYGGSPVLFAKLKGHPVKQPLPNVSSGINRAVAFMLAIASSENGVVIIDEIENGIHYSHLGGIWRSLIAFIREYKCQMVISTHSQECLLALSKAAGSTMDDIRLWQMDRGDGQSTVNRFSGDDLRLALQYHEEIR